MNTNEPDVLNEDLPVREFRDVHMYAQIAMGVVGALGLFAAIRLYPSGNLLAALVFAATLVALGAMYVLIGRPMRLTQKNDGLTIRRGNNVRSIPFDRLSEFSASWTDIQRNGVYQSTVVQFDFGQRGSAKRLRYTSSAMYQTQKYEDLQAFQDDVSAVVAENLLAELQEQGRIEWTKRLTLLEDSIEFRKNRNSETRRIPYAQLTRCELDQGLLKLAIDGSKKPNIVEKTNQTNFYPGLIVFEQLMGEATPETGLHDQMQTIVT